MRAAVVAWHAPLQGGIATSHVRSPWLQPWLACCGRLPQRRHRRGKVPQPRSGRGRVASDIFAARGRVLSRHLCGKDSRGHDGVKDAQEDAAAMASMLRTIGPRACIGAVLLCAGL
ncbi:hypothetical protein LOK49_LG11G01332 [Camellia lanceoleosa]|uniref:Uncharacterized protein n=1 Tax=Camellia lanceoleosa TaxID=1840588 RepID=A0ACC0G5C8_9ERIC|nr:hypothetical protein LOK49_LG11G01332 [Camellia lanceoleosa]